MSLRTLVLLMAAALAPCVAWPDQNDQRLDSLFQVLQSTTDPVEAQITEIMIWKIWVESGRDDVDSLMAAGIEAMVGGRIGESIELFDRVVHLAPGFAEGWNKRATAYYLNDDLVASVQDIERTLALEPRHFGALSGMGLIFLARGDEEGALSAFEEVLKIHPHAPGARLRVEELRKRIGDRGA